MNDPEVTQMLHHLKSMHFTYRQITKSCGFAKTKIANYLTPGGKSFNRCKFTDQEKARLIDFYRRAYALIDAKPDIDNALIRHKHGGE